MAELKTKPTEVDIHDYINMIENEGMRSDSFKLIDMMEDATNQKGMMWGTSILGFGKYSYKYASGREAEWMQVAFAPRKTKLVIYIMDGFKKYNELLTDLGKHKTGKSCLYIKHLSDIDMTILKEIIKQSVAYTSSKYGS
ncbi:MAG: DUF1801 domain-containing protein [Cyclobacteriaceae bacterium]